ncbi:hypothetical protein [Amycolatopsis sp. BJA-103]|uniref:hypothetical protein n=1 Tax=Amycolatopsis sp. BJA-103 TaxID=1911175 RepID=UPI000C77461D|nr:hypothetical protein [Amycolatopsis sp. BJA-103]AUI56796.1 hypothetical protein BKN51_00260 [Amycolatopsis sp. BJA-103]PNE13439.1 hypothetical protein B1H26_40130 [Amycolatopsis sp. BJA-103]
MKARTFARIAAVVVLAGGLLFLFNRVEVDLTPEWRVMCGSALTSGDANLASYETEKCADKLLPRKIAGSALVVLAGLGFAATFIRPTRRSEARST